jgi:DNA-binding SARP family transcriptional activator
MGAAAVPARFVAKLSAPRQVRIAQRPRVHDLIDEALRAGVCWLAAPAGYGKTTAVVDYLHGTKAPYVWYRVDEGDQDIARFYHYLARTLRSEKMTDAMPVFGAEYAERPREFARMFFRAYFEHLEPETVLALDDLHDANTPEFRAMLAVMLRELPEGVRCICLSRTLPQDELSELALRSQLVVVDQSALAFSDTEARTLVEMRSKRAGKVDVAAARGWAVGLVLLAEGGAVVPSGPDDLATGGNGLFDVLGRHFFHTLPSADQSMLLELNLLPEIRSDLANAMIGSSEGAKLLERLYHGQMLTSRVESNRGAFHLHDLLREFLDNRFSGHVSAEEQGRLRVKAATVLRDAGRVDEAIALALLAGAWALARGLILERAAAIISLGGRATFIEWCGRLPQSEMNAWLYYWLGVAHMPDDAAAERYFARAWSLFEESRDLAGQCLTVARTILVKTDSWRTHEGLAVWTQRAGQLLDRGLPQLAPEDEMLAWIGIVRALDFTDEDRRGEASGNALTVRLLHRVARPSVGDPTTLRLLASEALIERAVSTGQSDLFEQAVDSVINDLRDPAASPWALGMWLVAFGAAAGRYFAYARRGFPYGSADDALRAAIEIGESQSLAGVEFGGLYHLQLQMKLRNDFTEFGRLVGRLGEIADSRYTTQVAVVADCQAAMHTWQEDFPAAYRDCERFMASIEAADEPLLERWPHYVTKYQVLLGDGKAREAAALLNEILPRLEGGMHARTVLCIRAAVALAAKWNGDETYANHLRAFIDELRAAQWPAVLLNLPGLLAELLADALECDFEVELCRSMIARRRLVAPARRPESWPWSIKVRVLGDFRIERDGAVVDLGAKAPTRALDILRMLAVSKEHACSLESLQDVLWPDLDGDQAKAACEQALHRLRKLLGGGDLIAQREGRLRLATDRIWVDLADWEARLQLFSGADAPQVELERLFRDFSGTLLFRGQTSSWAQPVAERVQNKFVELAIRLGKPCEARGDGRSAQAYYLRALEIVPHSARLSHALIKGRLAQGDAAGAIDEYSRYERTLKAAGEEDPSPAIRALVQPLLKATRLNA